MRAVRVYEAPEQLPDPVGPEVFLAGGITACPDWQAEVLQLLDGADAEPELTVYNPRRTRWDFVPGSADDGASREQVAWEFRALRRSDAVLFWFPASASPQPIALYELGYHVNSGKPLAVGCDPAYPRRRDVEMQLALARPEQRVYAHLEEVVREAETLAYRPWWRGLP